MLPKQEIVPTVPFAAAPVRPPSSVSSLPGSCTETKKCYLTKRLSPRYLFQLLLCGLRPLFLLCQVAVQGLHLLELLLVHLGEIGGFPEQVPELTALNVYRCCAYDYTTCHKRGKKLCLKYKGSILTENCYKTIYRHLCYRNSGNRFARVLNTFPDANPQQELFRMIRIHEVLIRIRIHGCISLDYGSGSCSFHLWLSRCQKK
jgi:hypothetical protein